MRQFNLEMSIVHSDDKINYLLKKKKKFLLQYSRRIH